MIWSPSVYGTLRCVLYLNCACAIYIQLAEAGCFGFVNPSQVMFKFAQNLYIKTVPFSITFHYLIVFSLFRSVFNSSFGLLSDSVVWSNTGTCQCQTFERVPLLK